MAGQHVVEQRGSREWCGDHELAGRAECAGTLSQRIMTLRPGVGGRGQSPRSTSGARDAGSDDRRVRAGGGMGGRPVPAREGVAGLSTRSGSGRARRDPGDGRRGRHGRAGPGGPAVGDGGPAPGDGWFVRRGHPRRGDSRERTRPRGDGGGTRRGGRRSGPVRGARAESRVRAPAPLGGNRPGRGWLARSGTGGLTGWFSARRAGHARSASGLFAASSSSAAASNRRATACAAAVRSGPRPQRDRRRQRRRQLRV